MRFFLTVFFTICMISYSGLAEAEDKIYEFEKDGYERRYLVHVPAGKEGHKNLPVVLSLHGGGGSINSAASRNGMAATSDKYGFLLVFPEGTGKGKFHVWNGGHCCGAAMEDNVDDVAFLSEVIDRLARDFKIDRRRVYSTGLSNGALMSYRLSCELSDKIAAIAPVASQIALDECRPSRAVPTFHIHGTKDNCSLYEGGECGGCFADFFREMWIPMPRKARACFPVPDTIKTRAEQFKCNMSAETTFQNGDVTCKTYSKCQGDAEVTLCTVDGGGHSWPGDEAWPKFCDKKPKGFLCRKWKEKIGKVSMDMDANEEIWKFFSKYKLPN